MEQAKALADRAAGRAGSERAAADGLFARQVNAVRQQSVISSTNPSHRWLIAADGVVMHTVDGGSTWDSQRTGVTVTLTAGASPSALVCWLVGPRGTVLISTDGRSWQTLPFQEKVDLVSVRATDDKAATVIAADGRAFTTTDRGVRWTPSPNR